MVPELGPITPRLEIHWPALLAPGGRTFALTWAGVASIHGRIGASRLGGYRFLWLGSDPVTPGKGNSRRQHSAASN